MYECTCICGVVLLFAVFPLIVLVFTYTKKQKNKKGALESAMACQILTPPQPADTSEKVSREGEIPQTPQKRVSRDQGKGPSSPCLHRSHLPEEGQPAQKGGGRP